MTAVRGDLIDQVLDSGFIEPETLTADEWYEILVRSSLFLTKKSLRSMRTLRQAIISSDISSGILSQVDEKALELAFLPTGLNRNTAFLMCAHVALRPEALPGEAIHILMSRDLAFYELRISWSMALITFPKQEWYYRAFKILLEPRDLRELLKEYAKVRFGTRDPKLIPEWILWSFLSAQKETVEDLERELSEAQHAHLRLDRVQRILRKMPTPAVA